MIKTRIIVILVANCLLFSFNARSQTGNVLTVNGHRFELNGKPFEFTGLSFFNAIYNPEFNSSSESRQKYLKQFREYGINVLRVWCQWDNSRGFTDGGRGKTMYESDGLLNQVWLGHLKAIISDADLSGCVIELVLFSRESWNENIRLDDIASEKAVGFITLELKPYRNLIFQVWNEFSHRTLEYLKIIKSIDQDRIVTNSPGYAGDLGSLEENRMLDYLSPHTTRDDNRHWEIAGKEIEYLLKKYNKPVVDDEPARKGTPQYGGPKTAVMPTDHLIHIYNVWRAGGYVTYHHDMFQTGYGSEAVPSNGIPTPGFSKYHDVVFEFLKNKERYLKELMR
jgi:hypothetical protein